MLEILHEHGLILLIGDYPHGPLGGLSMTIIMSVMALSLTFPAAVLIALARVADTKFLRNVSAGFVHSVRSLPLLMMIFWIYYFLPIVIGVPISPFFTILSALVLYQAAYLSEVIRAAIVAIPKGQVEAARALGLGRIPINFVVILPQALKDAIPGIVNQLIIVIKETSLGYILAFNELTYAAGEINNLLLVRPLEVFAILAATYFLICFALSRASSFLETRLKQRESRAA